MTADKYPFFDAPEDDVSPLFTTKMQEAARVGCLRGVFDGSEMAVDWLEGNETLKSPAFDAELRDLLETLRRCGPLKDFQSMRQFCLGHPQARMSGRQTFYAFRIDTQRYRYHLRLFPQKGKFHIFCYQADQMREDLPKPDFNYSYGTFFIAGVQGERFVSLTDEQLGRFKSLYDNLMVVTAERERPQGPKQKQIGGKNHER